MNEPASTGPGEKPEDDFATPAGAEQDPGQPAGDDSADPAEVEAGSADDDYEPL